MTINEEKIVELICIINDSGEMIEGSLHESKEEMEVHKAQTIRDRTVVNEKDRKVRDWFKFSCFLKIVLEFPLSKWFGIDCFIKIVGCKE